MKNKTKELIMLILALICCIYVFFVGPIVMNEQIQTSGSYDPIAIIAFIVAIPTIYLTTGKSRQYAQAQTSDQ